jgi:F-box domain
MQPIPIDVLEHILGHLDQASLAKICQLNKSCCSCAQDVLYRNIRISENFKVCDTLAQSTHLARRVRLQYIYFQSTNDT